MDRNKLDAVLTCVNGYVASGHLEMALVGVAENGEVAECRSFGNCGNDVAALRRRQFALASISKAITGVALARAWEDGQINYDEPICVTLPEFASDDRRRRITIRHILTHTSGLPSRFVNNCSTQDYSYDSVLRLLYSEDPIAKEPGSQMAYSSYTYQLINEVVRRKLGVPMSGFMKQYLLEPLGMADTAFRPHDWGTAVPVIGHPVPYGEAMEKFCKMEMSGSGMWSTMDDLLRLGNALIVPGRFLRQDTLDMFSTVTLSAPKAGTTGEMGARTLGWVKEPTAAFPGKPLSGFYHGGATGTLLWIDPGRRLVFVFLTNRWGSGNEHAFDTLSRLY